MADKLGSIKNELITKLKGKGFVEIIFSTTLVKAIMFLSAMFLPRFLTKPDYGSLSYAETMVNYYLLLSGLGLNQAALKFCVAEKDPEKKKGIFGATLAIGTLFNLVAAAVFIVIIYFTRFDIPDSRRLTFSMVGIPFFSFIFQDFQFYLRAHFMNRKYSIVSLIYTILYVGAQILLAILVGVYGVVFARYFAYPICIGLCIYFAKEFVSIKFKWPSKAMIKKIIVFSIALLMGSFFSQMVLNNESLFIGRYFKDSEVVANFKVATCFIQICVFFVDAVAVFIIPYFAKNSNNPKWLYTNFKKIYFYIMIFMTAAILFLMLTSKWIVLLVWGKDYLSGVGMVRLLLVAAWCQTALRAIPMHVLAFVGEEKYLVVVHILTCVVHAVTDYFIFNNLGGDYIGAGLIIAYLFSGLGMTIRAWHKLYRGIK